MPSLIEPENLSTQQNGTNEVTWNELEVHTSINSVKLGQYNGMKVIVDSKLDDDSSTQRRREDALPRLEKLSGVIKSLYDGKGRLAQYIGWVDRQYRDIFSLLFELPSGIQSRPVSLLEKYLSNLPPQTHR
jgi:hypothetical protein